MAHALAIAGHGPEVVDGTVGYYDREAEAYARATLQSDLSHLYPELLDRLAPGGLVLDAGSGAGRDVAAFLARGFRVEAFDASAALAAFATRLTGVPVEVASFEDWRARAGRYDGIWCFASLLHVPRAGLPDVIGRLASSLVEGGWLFASFKEGECDEVDRHGRRYTNLTASCARRLFGVNGLRAERVWRELGPAALGGVATWVYVLARRV